jgi:hypothetical protein
VTERRALRCKALRTAPATKPVVFGPFRPVQKELAGGVTDTQQRWLDDFIAAYTARTPSSKAHTARHRPHFADPRAVAGFKDVWKEMVYPIVAARSAGASLGFGSERVRRYDDGLRPRTVRAPAGLRHGGDSTADGIWNGNRADEPDGWRSGRAALQANGTGTRDLLQHRQRGRARGDSHRAHGHGPKQGRTLRRGLSRHQRGGARASACIERRVESRPIAPGIVQDAVANVLLLDYGNQSRSS